MTGTGGKGDVRGATAAAVVRALADGNPLPGGRGFAGRLDAVAADVGAEGPALVRDVLGRQPLFYESSAEDPTEPGAWSFERTELDEPERVPAGSLVTGDDPTGRRAWTLPDPPAEEPGPAQRRVDDAVSVAVESVDPDGVAVAFSGGVDSALVAAGLPEAPCYVAGFEGSHDVTAAREAAAAMDRELRVVDIDHDDLRRAVPELVRATGRRNAMDLNIALPLYLTAEALAADGVDRMAVGQGADELFGGYSKVVDPAGDHRVEADTVRGARRETLLTLPDGLERDVLAVRAGGVEPVTPLLTDRVVDAALRLPADLLATDADRKVALREAAKGHVPEPVRTADKKAVQYGTYVARELDRLARRAGFKRRMDDHVGRYIEALIAADDPERDAVPSVEGPADRS